MGPSRSIGWASTSIMSMNFTACLNGFVTMKHIFGEKPEADAKIVFYKGSHVWEATAKEAKIIGNDLIWFPRGNEVVPGDPSASPPVPASSRPRFPDIPNLSCVRKTVTVGKKVCLITNPDQACAMMDPSPVLADSGNVIAVIGEAPGDEKAVYAVSSRDGSCGSPVVNEFNQITGWHCSRLGSEANCFIPCTPVIVQKASGSIPSFPLAPSQAA